MIPFILLFAVAVLGCYFLVFLFKFQRDARREVVIIERALEGDVDEAAALAAQWDQGRGPTTPVARLRLARASWKAGDPHRAIDVPNVYYQNQAPEGPTCSSHPTHGLRAAVRCAGGTR